VFLNILSEFTYFTWKKAEKVHFEFPKVEKRAQNGLFFPFNSLPVCLFAKKGPKMEEKAHAACKK